MSYEPKPHQKIGTTALLKNQAFALFDDPGTGKSKQVIDAAAALSRQGIINQVVVLCPRTVIAEWTNPNADDPGEILKHGPAHQVVTAYQCPWLSWGTTAVSSNNGQGLHWLVINYDKLPGKVHYDAVVNFCKRGKTLLVVDESSHVKNHKAKRSAATYRIRQHCVRAVLLTGTPIGENLMDLYSQFNILNPGILNYMNYWAFRANFAIMGGYKGKNIIGYMNQEQLFTMIRPHFLARKREVMNQPTWQRREVELTVETWNRYRAMRDDMIVELSSEDVVIAQQAIVKIIRLSQITSGILEDRELSDEKMAALQEWLVEIGNQPVVVWCRFRLEIQRVTKYLREKGWMVGNIIGGQSTAERDAAIQYFKREGGVLVGQQQAGGYGLNLQHNCHLMAYLSNDYNLITRIQSEGRIEREGQTRPVTYVDFVAVGPRGGKTIDHVTIEALTKKRDLSRWTSGEWLANLRKL